MKLDIKKLDLDVIKDSIERIGKKELKEEALLLFAKNTYEHEIKGLNHRTLLWENDEIDENEINDFDFYNDKGYRYGILHEFNSENLLTLEREKDEETGEITETKAKIVDEAGKLVRVVLITRAGWVTVFLSTNWFNTINNSQEKSDTFVFVGGLTTKYKNLNTQEYEKVMNEDDEYAEFRNMTFNLWQVVQLVKHKNGSGELVMIEKQTEEEE